jgi:hypothetical protein
MQVSFFYSTTINNSKNQLPNTTAQCKLFIHYKKNKEHFVSGGRSANKTNLKPVCENCLDLKM